MDGNDRTEFRILLDMWREIAIASSCILSNKSYCTLNITPYISVKINMNLSYDKEFHHNKWRLLMT